MLGFLLAHDHKAGGLGSTLSDVWRCHERNLRWNQHSRPLTNSSWPYTAQMLSDLGANVTKIEAPWGDDTRGWGPPFATDFDGERVAAYFLCCNRGKTILQMNLKEEKDRLMKLIEWADVIVENFKPGTLERLIGPLPKDTIVCSISGYGATGPRRDEPGYDLALQARSGIMSITGEAKGEPVKVGVAWIDIITGLYAGNAILAALLDRERTGPFATSM